MNLADTVSLLEAARSSIERIKATIRKSKGGYKVVSEHGGKNLGGPYKSKKAAVKRLQQVEYFKHKG